MGEKSSTEWLDESMFKNEAEGSGRLENYSASDVNSFFSSGKIV